MDLKFRLRVSLGVRISQVMKSGVKASEKTLVLIGCSLQELMCHLEARFMPGMTWKNYGRYGWHIDHVVPCCSFDLTDEKQQRACFHFTNLQPLWWRENLSKGGRVHAAGV